MNMKKSFLILSLGLAASLQAQEISEAQAPAVNENVLAEAPVVEPAPVAETAPAEQAVEAAPAEAAPIADQPAENTNAQQVAEPATEAPAESQSASTETQQPAETTQPAEVSPAQETASAESAPAQQPAESTPAVQNAEPAEVAATPATVEVAQPAQQPTVAKVAGPLDVLHGSAYNTVGNEAAGSTITGNMATPRKMSGTKAAYFEPISERAIVSFGDARTYFIGFDNSKDLGILTAGMAFGKFGFSVDGSLGKKWLDIELADGSESNAVNTYGGTMVGATASLLAGPVDVVLSGHFIKPDTETYVKAPNSELDPKSWSATGRAAVSYSGNIIYWTAGVDFLRHDFKTKTKNSYYQVVDGENKLVTVKTSVSDTSSRTEIMPSFNIGGAVLEAEDAKVYIGVNTSFPIALYDEIEGIVDSRTRVCANLTPNIFGEVALSKYFMAFGGASFQWNVFTYEKTELYDNSQESRETVSGKTTVNVGTRFQYNRIAVEAALTKQFLQNPFAGFAKADGIMLDIGAFINF